MTQNSINNSASELQIDNLNLNGNTISSTDTNGNVIIAPDGTGVVSVTAAPIVPSTDRADSLGSTTNSWDNVYADGLSFDDGTNVLSVYEEGTWTPQLKIGGSSTGITYNAATLGRYQRIGNVVTIQCNLVLTNKGSNSGVAIIYDLPFPIQSAGIPFFLKMFNANIPANLVLFTEGTVGNTELSTFGYISASPVTITQLNNTHITNTTQFRVCGSYFTAP